MGRGLPTTSVVIVSYRPGDWLEDCTASALARADQVVVVDNGSSGATAGAIARRLGATTVRSGRNLGFAGGVALGLASTTGEVVGVLNDDAVAGEGWPASAAAILAAEPDVGAVTPKVRLTGSFAEVTLPDEVWHAPGDARDLGRQIRSVTVDGAERIDRVIGAGIHQLEHGQGGASWRWGAGPVPWYVPVDGGSTTVPVVAVDGSVVDVRWPVTLVNHAGSHLRAHGVAGEIGFATPDDGRFDERRDVFGFSGTAPVFRHEVLERIGSFAPRYFAYNEDTDWCLRAHLHGLRVVYDPGGVVTHRLSATSGGAAARSVQLLAQRNALLCLVRTAPWRVAARHLRRRVAEGPGDGVRRAVARQLPWAVASRVGMARSWSCSPEEVRARWVGADATWDCSPARRLVGS